jgi:protein phosphatase PTC7
MMIIIRRLSLIIYIGVYDNLPETMLIAELLKIQGEKNPIHLQTAANAIVLMARTIAFDSKYMSPFSKNAQKNGINAVGGKVHI